MLTAHPGDLDDRWIQHQRRCTKTKSTDATTSQSERPPSGTTKRAFSTLLPPRSLSGLQSLNIGTTQTEEIVMRDASEVIEEQPRKRAAIGDGISGGSASPFRELESPPPRRSKARPPAPYGFTSDTELSRDSFDSHRPNAPKKQFWSPDQDIPFKRSSINISKNDGYDIILQPETRPISQEQLVAEVKGIYAGLVMVEAKCIEVDNEQAALAAGDRAGTIPKLNNEQWQALIALHRTLLHEHHDFFLASQHPSASPALKRLASKYAMPARMWRHGIHSFLELLRHRLPASLDHMLAFIYMAYSMMTLLYETVPAFEDTWIECLGDLGRYRMAIEDDDIRDREVWTGVARHWYSKASDKSPTTGRLYHHLAILARPNALQQLFYYAKSLCVVVPFISARESILPLFEPVLNSDQRHYRLPPLDTAFIKAHNLLFTNRNAEDFKLGADEFLCLLDNQIGRVTRKFMEQGYHIAIANNIAMHGFAAKYSPLMNTIRQNPSKIEELAPQIVNARPFPEDHVMKGLLWADNYYPEARFSSQAADREENYELAFMTLQRKERILWLASRHMYDGISGLEFPACSRPVLNIVWSVSNRVRSVLQSIGRKFQRIIEKKRGQSLIAVAGTFHLFEAVVALPLDYSMQKKEASSFVKFFVDLWNNFVDQDSGSLVMNTTLAIGLSGSYRLITYCDQGSWRGKHFLESALAVSSIYNFFLASGELPSNWQVGMLASFDLSLNFKLIQRRVSKFPKSRKATAFVITTLSLTSAGALALKMPDTEGRYKNPWAQTAMLASPAGLFWTIAWEILVQDTGIAKNLEEGKYYVNIAGIFQRMFMGLLAVAVILALLSKN